MTAPKPVFGGISEDLLEEGGWGLMVGNRDMVRKHGSFREVQLAQATYSIAGKETLATVARRARFPYVPCQSSHFSERSGKLWEATHAFGGIHAAE